MNAKTLRMTGGLLMVLLWSASLTLSAQITWEGYYNDHEGGIGWDADGTGTEPAGDGHNNQYYYGASPDYDGIDPDPNAALGHFLECPEGFPEFMAALEVNNINISSVKLRYTLSSLGNDEEGIDWLTIGSDEYINYYGSTLKIYVQNELMISMQMPYLNFNYLGGSGWTVETPFMVPKDASLWSDEIIKELAAAFLKDMNGQSLQLTCGATYSGHDINANGRDGAWYNVYNGLLTKGCPEIPFKGLNVDHQGFAGWDADGTGPEPEGDGHSTVKYYIASPDYDGIDTDPEAALGHFLEGAKGFRNLLMQLEYRGYNINDLKLKIGLSSMGNDEQGPDWGNNWWNYYNMVVSIVLDNEPVLRTMSDTTRVNVISSYYTSGATFSPVKNISQNASEDAQIIANAFLLDLGTHQVASNTTDVRIGTTTFTGNGRNGAYWEIKEAKMIGMCGMVNCVNEGEVSGTFKADNSPYLVNGNIEVPAGKTLTIEPGTKIAFRGPYRMYVKGNIIAEGTKEEPITFTHSNPIVLWDGFDYDSTAATSDTSFFKHCIFEHGYGFGAGASNSGGIFAIAYFDKLVVENSVFRNNRVNKAGTYPPSGGAVALWQASPTFINCIFHNNQAKYGGAIIVYNDSDPIISNCLFYDNAAEEDGGAIEVYTNGDGIFINNTFSNNFAGRYGGAIDFYDNSNPSIINTIMWGNRANVAGNEVNILESSQPNFYYCNVMGGPDEFGGSEFTGEYLECIDEDPMFMESEELPPYYPGVSPCFNAGSPLDSEWYLEEYLPEFDLYGQYRVDAGCIDIGVYESLYTNMPEPGKSANNLFTIFPNPVSQSANIEFELIQTEKVSVSLYNSIGQQVEYLFEGTMNTGLHKLTFNFNHLENGMYFMQIQAGNTITTNKLIKN